MASNMDRTEGYMYHISLVSLGPILAFRSRCCPVIILMVGLVFISKGAFLCVPLTKSGDRSKTKE